MNGHPNGGEHACLTFFLRMHVLLRQTYLYVTACVYVKGKMSFTTPYRKKKTQQQSSAHVVQRQRQRHVDAQMI